MKPQILTQLELMTKTILFMIELSIFLKIKDIFHGNMEYYVFLQKPTAKS
jgi:hypothetical protein